jgi:hypothetical protein
MDTRFRSAAWRWLACAALSLGLAAPAAAQITASSASKNPGNSANADDGNIDVFSSVVVQPGATATTFTTRYSGIVLADIAVGNITPTLAGDYSVNFSVNTPGDYRVDVSTSLLGGFNNNDDTIIVPISCSADMSQVSGAVTLGPGLASGNLNCPDPGSRGNSQGSNSFSTNNSAAPGVIFGTSAGSTVNHTFRFTFTASANSSADEAAVKFGLGSSQSGQSVGGSPGNAATDGHFVTVTVTPLCGNGVIDSAAGEQCDTAIAGTVCCTTACRFASAGTGCSDGLFCNGADTCDASGVCANHPGDPCPGADGDGNCSESCDEATDSCTAPDPNGSACNDGLFCNGADTCSGGACSGHAGDPCAAGTECADSCNEGAGNCFEPSGTPCTGDGETCTLDQCNGAGTCAHPAGNGGTLCRAGSGDLCDPDETCDGVSTTCPADVVASGSMICNPGSGDLCDPAETCPGVAGQACPSDSFAPSTTVCRNGSGDSCDPAENCPGVPDAGCPADVVTPIATTCRTGSGDLCDPDEACTGVAGAPCPVDSVSGAFVLCRTGSGDACDPAENCTGIAGQACPSDTITPSGTACRTGSGDLCDPDELCPGTPGTPCPADSVSGASVTCRGSAGDCDLAENCTGTAGQACPPDLKSTVVCRGSAGDCDVAESCDGVSNSCPADAFAPATTVCRSPADPCDIAENCTGSSVSCPADTGQPDGDGDSVCDALDNCDAIANPGQANGDADALGDACDPCTNIVPTGQEKVKLTLTKLLAPTNDDKLSFKGFFTSVPTSPTIDPLANGMRFLIVDSTGAIPVDVTVPGGAYSAANKVGWKVNGSGTSWTYKNSGTTVPLINGIQKMQLKKISSPPGKYKFGVKGKNGSYPINQANLPLVGTLVIDVPFATTGQCGEAKFPAAPPAKPSCLAVSGGKTVKCK